MWWYTRYSCTLSPKFSEKFTCSMCSTLLRMTDPLKKFSKGSQIKYVLGPHDGLLANYSTRQVMQSKIGQTGYWYDNVEELQYWKHHYQEPRWLCHCFSCWHTFAVWMKEQVIYSYYNSYNYTAVTVFRVINSASHMYTPYKELTD